MPKITINELDSTSGGVLLATENVVYIPGFSTLTLASAKIGVPTLCKTVEEFTEVFGTTPKLLDGKDDKSFVMAYELLKLGMFVLYEVPVAMEGGTAVATVAELETSLTSAGFWTRLTDKGRFDIRFITSGAYAKADNAVITAMVTAASTRGDAIALVDHALAVTTKTEVQTFFETIFEEETEGKFAAGFTPWVHIKSDVYKATVVDNLLPGSYAYLASFAHSVQLNPSWLAIAGATRGRIPGLVGPEYVSIRYGELEANDFQSRTEGEIAINPICNINPYGFIIWGNRTLAPVGEATVPQSDLVASNFLNIRNIVASIKKTLFIASRGQTFEQNNDILWINFKAQITPLLDQMMTGNGIADYRLIKQKSSKKATFKAIIRIVPIEAVEDFDLTVELVDSIESVTE